MMKMDFIKLYFVLFIIMFAVLNLEIFAVCFCDNKPKLKKILQILCTSVSVICLISLIIVLSNI